MTSCGSLSSSAVCNFGFVLAFSPLKLEESWTTFLSWRRFAFDNFCMHCIHRPDMPDRQRSIPRIHTTYIPFRIRPAFRGRSLWRLAHSDDDERYLQNCLLLLDCIDTLSNVVTWQRQCNGTIESQTLDMPTTFCFEVESHSTNTCVYLHRLEECGHCRHFHIKWSCLFAKPKWTYAIN